MGILVSIFDKLAYGELREWKGYVRTNKGVKFYMTTQAYSRMDAKTKIEEIIPEGCSVIYIWESI